MSKQEGAPTVGSIECCDQPHDKVLFMHNQSFSGDLKNFADAPSQFEYLVQSIVKNPPKTREFNQPSLALPDEDMLLSWSLDLQHQLKSDKLYISEEFKRPVVQFRNLTALGILLKKYNISMPPKKQQS